MAKIAIFENKINHLLVCLIISVLIICNTGQPADVFSSEFVDYINTHNMSWKARKSSSKNMTKSILKKLVGADNSKLAHAIFLHQHKLYHRQAYLHDLPKTFDARKKWPACKDVIDNPRDQGECGNCWGFSVTGAATDRLCIATKGKDKFEFSVEDLTSCCKTCTLNKNGCERGFELEAWTYWAKHGIVSGGEYQSNKGCRPYSKSSMRGISPEPCIPQCSNPNYQVPYEKDKRHGTITYVLPQNHFQIQLDILQYGPVSTRLTIYEDFYSYAKGVFKHVSGDDLGKHAVKIIGWGEEEGIPYWVIVNSWGRNWGDAGLFKVPKGKNYLGIEECVAAGRFSQKLTAREYMVSPNVTVSDAVACLPKNLLIVALSIVLVILLKMY